MIYTQRKASENTNIFKIELETQKSSAARRESKFQTNPQKTPQNILKLKLLKSDYQLNNILFNHFIPENEMRI